MNTQHAHRPRPAVTHADLPTANYIHEHALNQAHATITQQIHDRWLGIALVALAIGVLISAMAEARAW